MKCLYITADTVGTPTGGGIVTYQESQALKELGEVTILDAQKLGIHNDPFEYDRRVFAYVKSLIESHNIPRLAHIYAGTFTNTVHKLREYGTRVSYTAAAHNTTLSKEEFEKFGIQYDFPHITNPAKWREYVNGYIAADLVICPSTSSKKLMESYGCCNGGVCVIPHGVHPPETTTKIPNKFSVGYLGQPGPDKGLIYLLEAWGKLNLKDARLILAGRMIHQILPYTKGGNIEVMGFVDSISDFYNACSIYCQPSVTEGFGIEVLEAMAHGRPVIVSNGAGAVDVVTNSRDGFNVPIRNPDQIAMKILRLYKNRDLLIKLGNNAKKAAGKYTWDKIRDKYIEAWRHIL